MFQLVIRRSKCFFFFEALHNQYHHIAHSYMDSVEFFSDNVLTTNESWLRKRHEKPRDIDSQVEMRRKILIELLTDE